MINNVLGPMISNLIHMEILLNLTNPILNINESYNIQWTTDQGLCYIILVSHIAIYDNLCIIYKCTGWFFCHDHQIFPPNFIYFRHYIFIKVEIFIIFYPHYFLGYKNTSRLWLYTFRIFIITILFSLESMTY